MGDHNEWEKGRPYLRLAGVLLTICMLLLGTGGYLLVRQIPIDDQERQQPGAAFVPFSR